MPSAALLASACRLDRLPRQSLPHAKASWEPSPSLILYHLQAHRLWTVALAAPGPPFEHFQPAVTVDSLRCLHFSHVILAVSNVSPVRPVSRIIRCFSAFSTPCRARHSFELTTHVASVQRGRRLLVSPRVCQSGFWRANHDRHGTVFAREQATSLHRNRHPELDSSQLSALPLLC